MTDVQAHGFPQAPARPAPPRPDDIGQASAVLWVDLDAIRHNYRSLTALAGRSACGAVVKADAYGLGAAQVASCLAEEGCRTFFVADLDEGVALRPHLPEPCEILVLQGVAPGLEEVAWVNRLTPVLNGLEQVEQWRRLARRKERPLAAALQVDTGMSRLGLTAGEARRLASDPAFGRGLNVRLVMSQLACAEWRDEVNDAQLGRLRALSALFPGAKASLAGSEGVFAGSRYHLDLVRPGGALYGLAHSVQVDRTFLPVVRLQTRIIQTRTVEPGDAIGYGRSYVAADTSRIAVAAIGYADGFPRQIGNRGFVHLGSRAARVVGCVSMDVITVDVTGHPPSASTCGAMIDVIGPRQTATEFAAAAGMLPDEVLSRLGRRCRRVHVKDTQVNRMVERA